MKRNPALDVLRAIAIFLVLGWHLPVPDPSPFVRVVVWPWRGFGWAGVDLFFVLSGFLVGGLLMAEQQKRGSIGLGRFYERRAFKIWPSYYLLIGILVANRLHRHDSIAPFIGNLLNIQNYTNTTIRHTWSLAVEEHFYLLLGLILLFLGRRNAINVRSMVWLYVGSVVIALGSRIAMVATNQDAIAVTWYTNCRIDSLCLGVLLAALYHFKSSAWDWLARHRPLLAAVAVGSVTIHVAAQYSTFMLIGGLWAISAGSAAALLLLFTAEETRGLGRMIRSGFGRSLAWIGERSYGIYLWHIAPTPLVVAVYRRVLPHSNYAAYAVAVVVWIAAAIVMGTLSHRLIEVPFLKLRDRLRPRVAAALDTSAPPAPKAPEEAAPTMAQA